MKNYGFLSDQNTPLCDQNTPLHPCKTNWSDISYPYLVSDSFEPKHINPFYRYR